MGKQTSSWILTILGLFILLSILIPFSSAVYGWIFFITGSIIMIVSLASVDNSYGITWVSALTGSWLIFAAFVPGIHSGDGVLVHNLITGIVVLLSGLIEMRGKEGRPVF